MSYIRNKTIFEDCILRAGEDVILGKREVD